MDEKQSLLERIRNCKSCAERRELMRKHANQFGDFASRQFERARSMANIERLKSDRIDSRRFAQMKRDK